MAYTDEGATFDTLQEAVDDDNPSPSIYLCAGTFTSADTAVYGVEITDTVRVMGAGEDQTILTGGGATSVLTLIYPARAIYLEGMELSGGYEDPDAYCGDPETPLACPSTTVGTGLGIGRTQATVTSVTIQANVAQFGAGVRVGPEAGLTLRDSRVVDNRATIHGGAAVIQEGGVLVSENTVWEGNTPDDIIFATIDDEPENVIVHASWNTDGATDFTCRFDTLTCE